MTRAACVVVGISYPIVSMYGSNGVYYACPPLCLTNLITRLSTRSIKPSQLGVMLTRTSKHSNLRLGGREQ